MNALAGGEMDAAVRSAAFQFLSDQLRFRLDGLLPLDLLEHGFDFHGRRVPLIVRQQGIWRPGFLRDAALTITTTPTKFGKVRPYEDELSDDGVLIYKYTGLDPDHYQNVSVRNAMELGVPLVYFYGTEPGRYTPFFATVKDDDRAGRCFLLELRDLTTTNLVVGMGQPRIAEPRRAYVTTLRLQRLHQHVFRRHVLHAYHERCAVCRLRHTELLDAAHILPDSHPEGQPIVPNGLSLCRLHHAAFDANILGIRPDLVVDIRQDVREETDGPMLKHGLQGFHDRPIHVPRAEQLKPKPQYLEERYEIFRTAA